MYPYISIFGYSVPTYGLCVCIAVFFSCALILKRARRCNIDFNDFLILVSVTVGCSMIMGCALYIFVTYDFLTLGKLISAGDFSFLENSGTVFYGGLIGGVFGCIIATKCLKINIESVEMSVVPYIPLGHAIGRIGCLLAGCCYGFNYDGVFAVSTVFDLEHKTHFPIQGVEAICNLLIMEVLLIYAKKKRAKYSILSLYLIMYSSVRFMLEFLRGDIIRGNFLIFSTSQWISLVLFIISLIIIVNIVVNNRLKKSK